MNVKKAWVLLAIPAIAATVLILVLSGQTGASEPLGTTERVSVDSAGNEGNERSIRVDTGDDRNLAPPGKIAFMRWHDSIWVANADGTDRRMLQEEIQPEMPIWSPDGGKVAYLSDDYDPPCGICVVVTNSDGSDRRAVATAGWHISGGSYGGTGHAGISWHPDGDLLAYTHRVGTTLFVALVGVDGSGQRDLTPGVLPSWSPDGSLLAYMCPTGGICLLDEDGNSSLLHNPPMQPTSLLSWSPDSQEVGFVAPGYDRSDAYAVSISTGDVRKITPSFSAQFYDNAPVWSPDGSSIALSRSNGGMWVFDADGTNPRRVASYAALEGLQVWSPDSRWITFTRTTTSWQLMIARADGSEIRNLTNDETVSELVPAWCPAASCGGPQPPPRRIVMFINGIGSQGNCDIDGWDWIRQALKSQTGMTDSDFMRYVYSSDGEAIPDCAANPGSSYDNIDTCWSLDNSPQDATAETLLGQAERLAWLLENYLSRPENSDVEISIVAHSQGGVLAGYMIREFAPQDDFQNLSRVTTLVTLDSPLRGFGGIAAKSLKAHHGCGALGLSYDSAYDMTKGWTGHVIERIEAPGRPATTLFTVHEMGLDQIAGPAEVDAVNDWESGAHWESDHLEVLTGDHNTVWNGSGDPIDTPILRRFITCAVTGIRPPGHCEAYAKSLLPPLTVSPDETVTEIYDAPDGGSTIDVLVEWPGSTVTTTLVSPSGRVIDANTSDPDVDHRSGDTFEGFQITDPEPGEWTIEVFGADVPPEGEEVYLSFSAVPDPSVDADGDLVWDDQDNCPGTPNGSQGDADSDGLGDACDDDNDNDGVLNGDDNCEFVPNADQEDVNGNGIGDACDPDLNDLDEDGVLDGEDNCPLEPNGDQADFDFDGLGDVCEDSDEDGCMDAEELGPAPVLGGTRDPLNPWDFYDVPAPTLFSGGSMNNRDSAVTILNDVLGVLEYTGTSPTFPCNAGPDAIPGNGDDRCYTDDKDGDSVDDGVAYDRSPGPVWSEAPNGAITILEDVLLVLAQTPHSCQTPP